MGDFLRLKEEDINNIIDLIIYDIHREKNIKMFIGPHTMKFEIEL